MKIQIEDHDITTSTRRDNYRWNIVFTVGNEGDSNFSRNLCANFADFAAFLQAGGVIDFYTDQDDEGLIYVEGVTYTFDNFIKEQMLTGGTDRRLVEYVSVKLSEVFQLI